MRAHFPSKRQSTMLIVDDGTARGGRGSSS
jgi:predicted phosphoribosyltransferase